MTPLVNRKRMKRLLLKYDMNPTKVMQLFDHEDQHEMGSLANEIMLDVHEKCVSLWS